MNKFELERKYKAVVLKEFTLHGHQYKQGEIISYKEMSYLIENMNVAGLISNNPMETK